MKIKATKKQIIAKLESSDITRQIDKMDLYREDRIISLEDAKEAAKNPRKHPKTIIHVKTYITSSGGTYGHQFLSCAWINVEGKEYREWYQASGSKTGGCGYDKISTAIGSAFNAIGLGYDIQQIEGTGQQEEFILALGKKLLGRKLFIYV